MAVKLTECNLFWTYESLEELQAYINTLSGSERALASMVMMLTMNTCAHLTNKE